MCMKYFIITSSPETSILLQVITHNSYDISDMNQNLTDWVVSQPILRPKGTTRKDSKKNFMESNRGPMAPPLPKGSGQKRVELTGPTKKPREQNTKTHLRG